MPIPKPRLTIGFLLILVAISAVVITLLEPWLNPPRPRISILGGPIVDRGIVHHDVYRRHYWIIQNNGRLPLILAVTGSTPQTGLSLWEGENLVIPPGAQGEIKLTFGSPYEVGKRFARYADLSTNDPDNLKIRLQIDAITGPRESIEGPSDKVPVRAKP